MKAPGAKDDRDLPDRSRHRNGRWVEGAPTVVWLYSMGGNLTAIWAIPPTVNIAVLNEMAAQRFFRPPCVFYFVSIPSYRNAGGRLLRRPRALAWEVNFESPVSITVVIRQLTPRELAHTTGEWGWRTLRRWRRLAARCLHSAGGGGWRSLRHWRRLVPDIHYTSPR